MIYRYALIVGLLFIAAFHVSGQNFKHYNPKVKVNGNYLKNPWVGGLNAPQFSEGDFNNDGIADLFVFDRVGNVPMVFLNGGTPNATDYTYAPEYLEGLPKFIDWVLLRDFDLDGVMDVFCYPTLTAAAGIEVWRGYYDDDKLQFELVKFPDFSRDIIPFRTLGGQTLNLAVTNVDLPAIDDIDSDGDMDVVTFNFNGGKIEYYENQSVERGFGSDSLQFVLSEPCWGGMYESGITTYLDLASAKGECAVRLTGVVSPRHSGSTLLTLDMDNDCDKEILLGDLSFDHVVMGINEGDCDEAWMARQDTFFPSDNIPINLPSYPATFYLDVDNDGIKDLLAAPNEDNGVEDDDVVWFYKNVGSNEFPEFALQQTDFLVDQMLDFGTGAFPTFFDFDRDGAMDLVVGNESFYDRNLGSSSESRLFLFKNTGDDSEPEFELIDDNWLDMRRFSKAGGGDDWGFNPSFGDLDSDGDLDLLVGSQEGGFYYFENLEDTQPGPTQFATLQVKFQTIDVGRFSDVMVLPTNNEGLNDIILTEGNGNINYYKNIGTPGNPEFEPDENLAPNSTFYGKIDLRQGGFSSGYGNPTLLNYNAGIQMVIGNDFGSIQMFDLQTPIDSFPLLDANVGNTFNGYRTAPAFEQLDIANDYFYEMVVGNYRGGLTFYKTDLEQVTVSVDPDFETVDFSLSPNPTSGDFSMTISRKGKLSIYNSIGQLISTKVVESGSHSLSLNDVTAGIYFLRFDLPKGGSFTRRLVKE